MSGLGASLAARRAVVREYVSYIPVGFCLGCFLVLRGVSDAGAYLQRDVRVNYRDGPAKTAAGLRQGGRRDGGKTVRCYRCDLAA